MGSNKHHKLKMGRNSNTVPPVKSKQVEKEKEKVKEAARTEAEEQPQSSKGETDKKRTLSECGSSSGSDKQAHKRQHAGSSSSSSVGEDRVKEDGLEELTLTTNGTRLAQFADDLFAAGVRRINVSLDTLDRQVFARLARRDSLPQVLDGIAAAQAAGLQVGVLLNFDPCARADIQSGGFAQMVPRDADLLPPAIGLTRLAETCQPKVSDAAVESELMTLINQIEMHAGKPAILRLLPAFEERHRTATALARDLWLVRDRARPDYAGRPWLLWSANSALVTEASEDPVEWVVVQK